VSGYTPWTDREQRERDTGMPDGIYGVSRAEMTALRAQAQQLLDDRDSTENMQARVAKHLRNVERSTARKVSRSLSMRLADVRMAIARLIDNGKVERDGDLWEDSVVSGQRYAAAYKWIGADDG
jgi:hypothetical protein